MSGTTTKRSRLPSKILPPRSAPRQNRQNPTTTRRLPDRTWHVSRGGARSSAAGDADERHDCDNDDATPLTIDYCDSDNDVGCSHPPSVSLRGISIQTNLVLSGYR